MKYYLLDTNILLLQICLHEKWFEIEKLYEFKNPSTRLLISVVTLGEIISISKQNNWGERKMKELNKLIDNFLIVGINKKDVIEAYANIDTFSQGKSKQHKTKFSSKNMGKNDLWIAATTNVSSATLLTMDKDFVHLKDIYCKIDLIRL